MAAAAIGRVSAVSSRIMRLGAGLAGTLADARQAAEDGHRKRTRLITCDEAPLIQ